MGNAQTDAMQQRVDDRGILDMQALYMPMSPHFVSHQPGDPNYN